VSAILNVINDINKAFIKMLKGPMSNDINENHDELMIRDEHVIRKEKVVRMREKGIDPWPAKESVTATAKQVIAHFQMHHDELHEFRIAGRILSHRLHGKTAFCHLQDRAGKVQIYLRKDILGDKAFEHFKDDIDLGDILWVRGTMFMTKTGEVTVQVQEFKLLSKCLYPLPEKFHGLTDVEMRYRQRYLDLICNEESRIVFKKRSNIVSTMRSYLIEHDFIEAETPMLHPIPGGAAARPFITHHNALHDDFYLRIAPELYLKRLVIGGFERVFEINRNFRNEGISTRHNPEFTMLEFYMAHEDYHFAMNLVEAMLKRIVAEVDQSMMLPFGAHMLDFSKPFARISIKDAVLNYGGLSEKDIAPDSIDNTLERFGAFLAHKQVSYGEKLFLLFDECAESKLIQPTFITDFPIEVSPLAKRMPGNSSLAARFELFIAGMELCNGFSELNDPEDQAERFKHQLEAHKAGDDEAHHYDADFIHALEYGLPPTVGTGIGIDRLTMLLTNSTSIKDVILFPTLKKKLGVFSHGDASN
jgi:lysyl-tRNA synthetase, class II